MEFFKFRDDFVGFKSEMMGPAHIILIIVSLLFMIFMMFIIRKKDEKSMDKFIKISSVAVFIYEAVYVTWEAVQCSLHGRQFDFQDGLPIYTCSIFIYALLLAAWTKGIVRESCLAFIATIGTLSGLTGIFRVNGLINYPLCTYGGLFSYFFHYYMLFVGVAIVVSKYYTVKIKSSILSFFPILALSIVVIPIDYILEADYMLLYSGIGAPVMPQLANFLASYNLRPLFTVIMLLTYIPVSLLMVGIIKGIELLVGLIKPKKEESGS